MREQGHSRRELVEWERSLGARFREARLREGMSQAEVATRMQALGFGIIQTTVAKMESGARPLRVSELVGLGQVLGLSWVELVSEADPFLEEDHPIRALEELLAAARQTEREAGKRLFRESAELARQYGLIRAQKELLLDERRRRRFRTDGKTSNPDQ